MLTRNGLFPNFIKLLRFSIATGLSLLSLGSMAAAAAGNSHPLDVLLIATYSQNNPATHDLEAGLNDALQFSIGLNNFHTEYLDVPRLSDADSGKLPGGISRRQIPRPPARLHRGLGAGEIETSTNSSWIEVENDYVSSLTELKRFYKPGTLYVVGEDNDKAALDRRNNFHSAWPCWRANPGTGPWR